MSDQPSASRKVGGTRCCWKDNATTSGTLGFALRSVTENIVDFTLGQEITGALSIPNQRDIYRFTAEAGTTIYYDGLSVPTRNVGTSNPETSTAAFRIIDPSGGELSRGLTDVADDLGPITLTQSGTYELVIASDDSILGDYRFRLLDVDVDATPITAAAEQELVVDIPAEPQSQVFRFSGIAGQGFTLQPPSPVVFGTAEAFAATTENLVTSGSFEDGFAGVLFGLENFDFRSDAAVNFIVVTDEDRDLLLPEVDRDDLLSLLGGQNAVLTSIVDANLTGASGGAEALGANADGQVFLPDGSGGFTFDTLDDTITGEGTTVFDYVEPAFLTGGSVFDIEQLRDISLDDPLITSLSAAFVDSFTQTVEDQFELAVIASDPNVLVTLPDPISGFSAGDTIPFELEFTGAVAPQSFDLQIVRADDPSLVFGVIPVRISDGYVYNVSAIDPDGDTVTFSLVGDDNGAQIDSATGRLAFTPTANGVFSFTVAADDGRGGRDQQTFDLTVTDINDGNTAPVITSSAPDQATANQPYAYQVEAQDPDGDALVYQLVTPVDGLAIDPTTGLVSPPRPSPTWPPFSSPAPRRPPSPAKPCATRPAPSTPMATRSPSASSRPPTEPCSTPSPGPSCGLPPPTRPATRPSCCASLTAAAAPTRRSSPSRLPPPTPPPRSPPPRPPPPDSTPPTPTRCRRTIPTAIP